MLCFLCVCSAQHKLKRAALICCFTLCVLFCTAQTEKSRSVLTCCFTLCFSPKSRTAASIILRGANDFMCDEMERSIHDALCVVRRVLESKTVVIGGGAVEAALSIYLENFATSLVSLIFAYHLPPPSLHVQFGDVGNGQMCHK